MLPKLSVIIPVYNGEKTIRNCIESVLNQSLTDIEVIVVNDGSTDSTEEMLNSIQDNRIKILSIQNSGQGIARNRGIEVANGKYVGFVDADDTIEKDMYEKMVSVAEKNNADVVQCAICDIKNGEANKRPDICDTVVKITDTGEYTDHYFYTLKHTNEVCNKIFLKSFLDKAGLRFSNTKEIYSEDLKLNIDMLPHLGCICFLEEALYNYNIQPDGHCLKNPVRRIEQINRLYDECIKNIDNTKVKRCIKSMAVINLLSYSVSLIDNVYVRQLISSKRMKNYMLSSAMYKKKITHTALMTALVILPFKLKISLIKKYYTYG